MVTYISGSEPPSCIFLQWSWTGVLKADPDLSVIRTGPDLNFLW